MESYMKQFLDAGAWDVQVWFHFLYLAGSMSDQLILDSSVLISNLPNVNIQW